MINIIRILLQDEEYNVKEFDGKIVLFKETSTIYPEEYIEVEKINSTGKFIVSEVHRDVKQIKVKTDKKEEAGIYAIIIYKKLYDDITDRKKARFIRNHINTGDEENVLAYCIDSFDDSVYSIDYEDNLKISLIRSKDSVDVKFYGEYIVQNAALDRGYVVFYNYCEKLQHISSFYSKIQQKLNYSIGCETILKLYIFGK